jgi:hypothetical protein
MTKRKRRPLGETIGGIVVGFDYQVFRATKPPAEMVEAAKPISPVAASGGGTIEIDLPGPTGEDPADESADGTADRAVPPG